MKPVSDSCAGPLLRHASAFEEPFASFFSQAWSSASENTSWFVQQAALGTNRKRIVDVGCGDGRLAFGLAAHGHQVLGLERSSDMLSRAEGGRAKLPAEVARRIVFQQGNALDILGLDGGFSVVSIVGLTFPLLTEEERRELLSAATKWLTDDGVVLLDYLPMTKGEEEAHFEATIPMRGPTPGSIELSCHRTPATGQQVTSLTMHQCAQGQCIQTDAQLRCRVLSYTDFENVVSAAGLIVLDQTFMSSAESPWPIAAVRLGRLEHTT